MKKRKKRLLSGLLAGVVLFLVSACAKQADRGKEGDIVYCMNSEGTGLVQVACEISKAGTEETAQEVLENLADPPESIEYMPAIPQGVTAEIRKVEHAIVYVDFNHAYLDMPSIQEKLVRAAVVRSLVRQEGIGGVWITVDQESIKNDAGMVLGILNESDFVESTGASPSSYEKTTLVLFFGSETGDKLVRQQMDVKYNSNISKEKLIMEKLMQGPQKEGAYPTVNPAATLLSATIKDGICYVNFDSEFLNSVYDVRPEITVYSIVNSLVEGTSAGAVQITVNGEKNVMYQETVSLSQPLSRDLVWEETEEQGEEKNL